MLICFSAKLIEAHTTLAATSVYIDSLKSTLPQLKRDAAIAQHEWELVQDVRTVEQQLIGVKRKLLWAHVRDEEDKCKAMEKQVSGRTHDDAASWSDVMSCDVMARVRVRLWTLYVVSVRQLASLTTDISKHEQAIASASLSETEFTATSDQMAAELPVLLQDVVTAKEAIEAEEVRAVYAVTVACCPCCCCCFHLLRCLSCRSLVVCCELRVACWLHVCCCCVLCVLVRPR